MYGYSIQRDPLLQIIALYGIVHSTIHSAQPGQAARGRGAWLHNMLTSIYETRLDAHEMVSPTAAFGVKVNASIGGARCVHQPTIHQGPRLHVTPKLERPEPGDRGISANHDNGGIHGGPSVVRVPEARNPQMARPPARIRRVFGDFCESYGCAGDIPPKKMSTGGGFPRIPKSK